MRMLLQFAKTDTVRHLGLLDLQRTMQRALRRSGLPVRYSSGFNPHIVMSFASALSTGVPGDAELLDVALEAQEGALTEAECLARMNAVLPPTLPAERVRLVDDRFPKLGAALAQAAYSVELAGGDAARIAGAVPDYLAQSQIMALRKSKTRETLVDIRPMIHDLTAKTAGEDARLTMRVSFVEAATLKPELLLSSLCTFAGAEMPVCRIRRTGLLGVAADGRAVPLIDL